MRYFSGLAVASIAAGMPLTAHPDPVVPRAPLSGTQITLREVVEEGFVGISREPAEVLLRVRQSARDYAAWKRGTLPERKFAAWKTACEAHPEQDDFCPLVLGREPVVAVGEEEDIREEPEEVIDPASLPKLNQVVKYLKDGDLSGARRASSSSLYRALRSFKSYAPLEKITERTLAEGPRALCDNPALPTALAQKAEMMFPNTRYREMALQLFSKVLLCKGNEAAQRAKFRYSLFKFEDGDYARTDALMGELYSEAVADYGSRALYWRARAAQAQGNKIQFEALSQKLLKEYPLSYHSIVLNRTKVSRLSRVMGAGEPTVLVRSQERPDINSWIRVAEGLQSIGEHEYARRVMTRIHEHLVKTEPELRLYVGALFERSGDPVSQFRVMSTVFKDAPRLLTQATLKLFYPIKNMDAIRRYSSDTDPFFVASLIRQESGFNPFARSRVGASGLMQLMPATARSMEAVTPKGLFNPTTNIRLGSRYIARLVNRYHRDAELALAAYNAGVDRVDEWKKRYSATDRMLFFDLIPYKETRDYVVLISRNYFWYNNLYGDLLGVPVKSPRKFGRAIAATPALPNRLIFTLSQ